MLRRKERNTHNRNLGVTIRKGDEIGIVMEISKVEFQEDKGVIKVLVENAVLRLPIPR